MAVFIAWDIGFSVSGHAQDPPPTGCPLVSVSLMQSTLDLLRQTAPPLSEWGETTGTTTFANFGGSIYLNGQPFFVSGMNWYGMEMDIAVPEGLWTRDLTSHLEQMRDLGVNVLRLPWALEGLLVSDTKDPGVYFQPLADPSTVIACPSCLSTLGTPVQILDEIFRICRQLDIYILLDLHRLHFRGTSPLWHDRAYSMSETLAGWAFMVDRYGNQSHFLGMDLYNEPHGNASFGTTSDGRDFLCFVRTAVDTVFRPVLQARGKLLFVSGINWGEDMRNYFQMPAEFMPFLVLSPHSYGPTLTKPVAGWEDEPWRLQNRWISYFFYLHTDLQWTLVIGEWGGNQDYDGDVLWMEYYTQFLERHHIGQCFWAWNPNSKDVRGFLGPDWRTPVPLKLGLWNRLRSLPR